MALLLDLETFKCSPALVLKCLADVPMYVTSTSREQINLCSTFGFLNLRLDKFGFSKKSISALLSFCRLL